ncbi:MAG: hypothetical protein C4K58_07020 [Flavobacteriaceae bacterium]|nr:MAG: hypothetical protein C4K58_07020 [Flavobacteriaceae bacterium]
MDIFDYNRISKLRTQHKKACCQQGIAKSGAEVLNRTFVHFMYLCARLNICAFKTPTSPSPET